MSVEQRGPYDTNIGEWGSTSQRIDPLAPSDTVTGGRGHSLGDRILADLMDRLAAGEWSPGARLPSIRTMTQQYGVTPLTMSRVVRRLVDLGHVTTIPGKGVYAADRAASRPAHDAEQLEWQRGLFRRRPFRAFTVSLPQGMPADTINLASGTMSNEAVPIGSIRSALTRFASSYAESPISQRSPLGETALREWLQGYLARANLTATPDNILVVTSLHQALRLLSAALIDSGDAVLIESPSDPIVIGVLESLGARCIAAPVDANGMNVEVATELVQRFRPKMIVTSPTGQVPTGVTMPASRRRQLVEMAAANRTLIVEYDLSAEISFDATSPKPLKSWDRFGCVVYVREFSRITAAGFRISCLTVEGPLFTRLADGKRRDDFIISTVAQMAFLSYVTSRSFERNIAKARDFYATRRDATLRALERSMPPSVRWYPPASGFHLWLSLPPTVSARELTNEAALRGVIVAPSEIFSIDGRLDDGIRITFSDNDPDVIELGIGRLAAAVSTLITRGTTPEPSRVFEIV